MNEGTQTRNHSGLATASLVLGILAVVFGLVGIGGILGILAIVFGAVSLKADKSKSIAGIITGGIGVIISILVLIFITLIMPLSLVALRENQRDTQRKEDVSILVSDVTGYVSNNRGQLPDNDWVSGMAYKLNEVKRTQFGNDTPPTTDTANYRSGEDCDGNMAARKFSLTILLERGGSYCMGS